MESSCPTTTSRGPRKTKWSCSMRPILPTTNNVVNISQSRHLHFNRGKQEGSAEQDSRVGWLTIRPAYRVAWIIDGQHRLFSYADHPMAKKSVVSVIAFVGLEASEQARLF